MIEEQQNIIRLLANQDKKAIAHLYDQYGSALFGVILKVVKSEEIAKDVLQESFIKIWKNGPKYDTRKGTLFTWMLNIARNTAIDKTRSANFRQKGNIQGLDYHVYNIGTTGLTPEHIGLRNVLDQLDPKYKKVIDLVYFQAYTQKEVVEELGIPLGTVKSRVKIGLRELRKIFEISKVVLLLEFIVNIFSY